MALVEADEERSSVDRISSVTFDSRLSFFTVAYDYAFLGKSSNGRNRAQVGNNIVY